MSIVSQTVAKTYSYVIGVDNHAKKHVYAIITNTGEHLETRDFPTTATGIKRALAWAGRRTGGDASTLWVVEGSASYGAILTGTLSTAGYPVAEAPDGYQKAGREVGKTDPLDALRMALTGFDLVSGGAQKLGRGGDGHRIVQVREGEGQTESRRTCFVGDGDRSVVGSDPGDRGRDGFNSAGAFRIEDFTRAGVEGCCTVDRAYTSSPIAVRWVNIRASAACWHPRAVLGDDPRIRTVRP